MDCQEISIMDHINLLKNNKDYESTSAIMSSLDHRLAKMSKKNRLKALDSITEDDINGINHEDSVLIAAMIEFAYNENNKDTSNKWFMSNKFKLNSIMDNSFLIYFNSYEQKRQQAEIAIKTSAKELKWRNMVGEKVIDAI